MLVDGKRNRRKQMTILLLLLLSYIYKQPSTSNVDIVLYDEGRKKGRKDIQASSLCIEPPQQQLIKFLKEVRVSEALSSDR